MPTAPLTREDIARQSPLAWFLMAVLAGTALWFWIIGARAAAVGTAASWAGCAALLLPPRERMAALPMRLRALPRACDAAPVFATILSAPGYGLGWFYGDNLYDEAVHLLNGLVIGLVLACLILADGRWRGPLALGRSCLWLGLALAIGWEAFEAATGLIGDVEDTLSDIALTTCGAAAGAMAVGLRGVRPAVLWPARGDAG